MRHSVPWILGLLIVASAVSVAPTATAAHAYRDVTIRSFDGTMLAATVFTPEVASYSNPVPWILMTHGWAGERIATPTGRVLDLLDAGYGVLTWDSRGFGASGGEVHLNSPDFEVRDVKAIVSYLATDPVPVLKDSATDPRVGMSGGSYAGAIQLLAAAHDPRIDVIAPENTWHDLNEALAPNGVPKLYWTSLLLGSGLEASCVNARNGDPQNALTHALLPIPTASSGCVIPDLVRWYAMVHTTGTVPPEVREALAERSPSTYIDQVRIPTLLVQGYPDTLFDANQAIASYAAIKANGAPVKLWLYDGGHSHPEGPALPNTQGPLVSPLVIRWMDRYLKGDTGVDTGHKVEYFADGAWFHAPTFPLPEEEADRSTTIPGFPTLLQAPVVPPAQGTVSATLMQGPATLTGTARLSFFASGIGREAIIFASLHKENENGRVRISDQTQPIRFNFSVETGLIETDLVAVAAQIGATEDLVLVLSSTDPLYDGPRGVGFVNIEDAVVRWQVAG